MSDHGYFVDSDGEMDVEDNAEPVERYNNGEYYPLRVGEVIEQTYRIEHKLGHGGFSTVWMASDLRNNRHVALKVTVSGSVGGQERHVHEEICQRVHDTSGLLLSSGTFHLAGLGGRLHTVLVFPLRGPSIGACLHQTSMRTRMSVVKQTLQALASLHNAGLVHRDLNSRNIMRGMHSLDGHNVATIYTYLGRPQKIALPSNVWKRGELVRPMEVPLNLLTDEAYVGDFGLTITAGTPIANKLQSPAVYCAPERFHNVNPSYASDIWSYMCIFTQLYIGVTPWGGVGDPTVVGNMVKVLGPLPEHWNGCYYSCEFRDASWYDRGRYRDPELTLESILARKRPDASNLERSYVLSILSKGLCYDPERRITAAELLQHTSFQALMNIYMT